jgi:hypothetical protein
MGSASAATRAAASTTEARSKESLDVRGIRTCNLSLRCLESALPTELPGQLIRSKGEWP